MKLFPSILLILLSLRVQAQTFINTGDHLVNGYSEKISGLDYEYQSCIPGLRESLLCRATSGKDFVEWETAEMPSSIKERYAAVVWVAAIGSSPGKASMKLDVNDRMLFTFHTDGRESWELPGQDGSSLSFNSIMTDQHGDRHGYMILRIPSGKLPSGKLRIRVTGNRDNLTSWYMTFRKKVESGVTFVPFPAIIRKGSQEKQLVEAGIFYFGKEAPAQIYLEGKLLDKTTLRFGYNNVSLGLDPVTKATQCQLKVTAGSFSVKTDITLEPVRKWDIRFIQHSHTDIGYTRSQTDILAEHLRYIDYALDYCDATDSYPDNAKFRWTCEASWPVDEYIRCRPAAQVERLMKRIKEKRIEVTGMYFNFDELPDERILASSLSAAGRLKEKGIPVTIAMQNDVNGIGWCMNDYFSKLGIKYLNMGTHGHRALICFDIPAMFWWESPSGNRILTFRAEHYMTGNTVLEIQSGDIDRFRNNLLNYLSGLQKKGYPFSEMAIQHSGYLTDNSPPSTIASDLVKRWNELFVWPKISTSTAEAFFEGMERDHGRDFPVIRGAWPDWWTDGFGASARETATTRIASSALAANSAGMTMAAAAGVKLPEETSARKALAENALLFYTEHTTGYSESVREPLSKPTMEQRAMKESYAWEANRRTASIGEETMGLLQSLFEREKEPSLLVFNTLSRKRSGLATVFIDHQIIPRGKTAGIFDSNGKLLSVQPLQHRSDVTEWAVWLEDVPAFGYKKYTIRPVEEKQPASGSSYILENKWYRLEADKSKGTVVSWIDKELQLELLDRNNKYGMGEFILEKLGNRSQMESRKLDDYRRLPLDTAWFDSMTENEIWNSIKFYGESETAEGPRGFMIEFRLFNTDKRLDVACSVIKKSIVSPESFYIAFPFGIKDGTHFTEVQGGVIEAGIDQIKGSSNDWYTVQNFTSVKNGNGQIIMGCAEMPLMQFGAINTGRYQAGAVPQTPSVFSWPMNNYWVTNFNADQRGGHTWTYYLTSSPDVSNGMAEEFGSGCRTPFLTRILPGAGTGDGKKEGSFISGWPGNVLLVSAFPEDGGKSCILHLRETGHTKASLELANGLTGQKLKTVEVDVTGREIKDPSNEIMPLQSKFFRVWF